MRGLIVNVPQGNPPQYVLDYWGVLQKYEAILAKYSALIDDLYNDEYAFNAVIEPHWRIIDEQISSIIHIARDRVRRLKSKLERGWLFVPMMPRKPELIARHDRMVDISINDDPEYKNTYNPLAPKYFQRVSDESQF